jgi:hypothetical protein
MGEGDRVFWKDGGCESHSQEKGAIRELGVLGFQEPMPVRGEATKEGRLDQEDQKRTLFQEQ